MRKYMFFFLRINGYLLSLLLLIPIVVVTRLAESTFYWSEWLSVVVLIGLAFLAFIGVECIADHWRNLGLRYAKYAQEEGDFKYAQKALRYFLMASMVKDHLSLVNLGLCYAEGIGVEKDPVNSAECYRQAAKGGNSFGRLALGYCYAHGIGVEKDRIKAEDLYQIDADKMDSVEECLKPSEVIVWMRDAAERGQVEIQKILSGIYEEGLESAGVVEDKKESFSFMYKAAEQGDALAQMSIGEMYASGEGVEKDINEAVLWLRKAAEQGDSEAQVVLGSLYGTGDDGLAKDCKEAFKWLQKAADQGNDEAQLMLGYMYDKGEFVAKDQQEAVKWYRKAADQGNAEAKSVLMDIENQN